MCDWLNTANDGYKRDFSGLAISILSLTREVSQAAPIPSIVEQPGPTSSQEYKKNKKQQHGTTRKFYERQ